MKLNQVLALLAFAVMALSATSVEGNKKKNAKKKKNNNKKKNKNAGGGGAGPNCALYQGLPEPQCNAMPGSCNVKWVGQCSSAYPSGYGGCQKKGDCYRMNCPSICTNNPGCGWNFNTQSCGPACPTCTALEPVAPLTQWPFKQVATGGCSGLTLTQGNLSQPVHLLSSPAIGDGIAVSTGMTNLTNTMGVKTFSLELVKGFALGLVIDVWPLACTFFNGINCPPLTLPSIIKTISSNAILVGLLVDTNTGPVEVSLDLFLSGFTVTNDDVIALQVNTTDWTYMFSTNGYSEYGVNSLGLPPGTTKASIIWAVINTDPSHPFSMQYTCS